jgi:hypothetical protein
MNSNYVSVTEKNKDVILGEMVKKFGENAEVSAGDISNYAVKLGYKHANFLITKENRISRGMYKLPKTLNMATTAKVLPMVKPIPTATAKFNPNIESEHAYAQIPKIDKHYVAFGDFKDVETIIESKQFFPVFISGLSGNGKTFMVEQAAAKVKRPMIRVQLSRETDEDDLMGGFRLINGETKFMKGPVLRAMELGVVLLLDEADRADPGKIMCLQGILEGKPYFVKKTGEVITPTEGFNIIVTANTKGKGSDDGRYVAAAILDDAWLERFPITIEQKFPNTTVERKILLSYLMDNGSSPDGVKFIDNLIAWAEVIRKTFNENAIDEVISTRRLVHIIRTYGLFPDRMRAVRLCINRFDEETKTAFLDLYSKVDETINPKAPVAQETTETVQPKE